MKIALNKVEFTKGGFLVKGLTLTESKEFIVGRVCRNDLPENIPKDWVNFKWIVSEDNSLANSGLPEPDYDIDLTNVILGDMTKPIEKRNWYQFKEDAFHCKIYKWIYGKWPHEVHPTMCPYFWIMVGTLLLFPLVLIIKMFGSSGTLFLNWCKDYRKRSADRTNAKIILRLQSINDPIKAYKAIQGKCWDEYKWKLSDDDRYRLHDLYNKQSNYLNEIERENFRKKQTKNSIKASKRIQRKKDIKVFKESKITKVIGFIFLGFIILICGYFIYKVLGVLITSTPWDLVGRFTMYILAGVSVILAIVALIRYVIYPILVYLFKWFSCINLPKCVLCQIDFSKYFTWINFKWLRTVGLFIASIFTYIFDAVALVWDIIYNIYKKNCPTITWIPPDKK